MRCDPPASRTCAKSVLVMRQETNDPHQGIREAVSLAKPDCFWFVIFSHQTFFTTHYFSGTAIVRLRFGAPIRFHEFLNSALGSHNLASSD